MVRMALPEGFLSGGTACCLSCLGPEYGSWVQRWEQFIVIWWVGKTKGRSQAAGLKLRMQQYQDVSQMVLAQGGGFACWQSGHQGCCVLGRRSMLQLTSAPHCHCRNEARSCLCWDLLQGDEVRLHLRGEG